MIGYLSGTIKHAGDGYVILDCNDVGYRVELGLQSVEQAVGEQREFFIYTHVRETELRLFGFEVPDDLKLFECLISVNGVGPKVGLSLISGLGGESIVNSILENEPQDLKVPGVGKKTAEKIVLELGDKLQKVGFKTKSVVGSNREELDSLEGQFEEVEEALESLGYSSKDIPKIMVRLQGIEGVEKMSTEELVRLVLRKQ